MTKNRVYCREKYQIILLVFLILFMAFSAGCSRVPGHAPERPPEQAEPHRPAVGAFYVNGRGGSASYDSFSRNRSLVSEVSPLWYHVREDGSLEEEIDRGALKLARDSKVKVIPLVAFSSNRSSAVLTAPGPGETAIAAISRVVREHGYDGINIDFEIIKTAGRDYQPEREGLTRFAAGLREEMDSLGRRLDICVLPPKQPPANLAVIYDHVSLAGLADRLVVLAYDYSHSGTAPGPVAPLPWVEENIEEILSLGVPAEKLSLGIASYGYDWPSGGTRADAVTAREVTRKISRGVLTAGWDDHSRTPYVKYRDALGRDREIWFENSASVEQKLDMITKYRLAGFSLWRLGYEEDLFWQTVQESLLH